MIRTLVFTTNNLRLHDALSGQTVRERGGEGGGGGIRKLTYRSMMQPLSARLRSN